MPVSWDEMNRAAVLVLCAACLRIWWMTHPQWICSGCRAQMAAHKRGGQVATLENAPSARVSSEPGLPCANGCAKGSRRHVGVTL
jgi:hypothetical protein